MMKKLKPEIDNKLWDSSYDSLQGKLSEDIWYSLFKDLDEAINYIESAIRVPALE